MKQIPLTQGKVMLVDDEDYEKLSKIRWAAVNNGYTFYAIGNVIIDGKMTRIGAHRYITKCPKGLEVDHVDGYGWNNQKSNLKNVNRSENQLNTKNHRKDKPFLEKLLIEAKNTLHRRNNEK